MAAGEADGERNPAGQRDSSRHTVPTSRRSARRRAVPRIETVRVTRPDLQRRGALEKTRGRLVYTAFGFGLLFLAVIGKLADATIVQPLAPHRPDRPIEALFTDQKPAEATALAQKMKTKTYELRATISLARLLRDTNRRDEARTMLAEIYNWFTEGFDTADLKDAKALLEELSNSP